MPNFFSQRFTFKDEIYKYKLTHFLIKYVGNRKQGRDMTPYAKIQRIFCKTIWNFVKEVPELLKYFPDLEKDEVPDRTFLWTVLSTLRPIGWKSILEVARKIRTQQSNEDQNELIEIYPDLLDKLIAAPMLTKGKYISTIILTAL